MFPRPKIKFGIEAHRYAESHVKQERILEINSYILSSLLLLFSILLSVRVLFVKQKGFLMIMCILLVVYNSMAIYFSHIQY